MAKRGFSSGLQAMKFMQRGRLKEEAAKQDEREDAEILPEEAHDQDPETSGRCVVIMEGDPRPGTTIGRMSFKNFNPEIDRLQEEIEARKAQVRVRVASAVATATVATTSVAVKVQQHWQPNDNDDKGKAGSSTSSITGSDENPARKKLKAELPQHNTNTSNNKHRPNSNKHNSRNRFDALQGARFRVPPKF